MQRSTLFSFVEKEECYILGIFFKKTSQNAPFFVQFFCREAKMQHSGFSSFYLYLLGKHSRYAQKIYSTGLRRAGY